MPFYVYPRKISPIGLIAQVVAVGFLLIIALICVANRGWFETKFVEKFYGDRAHIHSGAAFRPGATATEDDVEQTAVLVDGKPHVQVKSPPAEWRAERTGLVCTKEKVCTAPATPLSFAGGAGLLGGALGGILPLLLAFWMFWTMFVDD